MDKYVRIMNRITKYSLIALLAAVACNKVDIPVAADYDSNEIVFTTKDPKTRGTNVSEVTSANLTTFNVVATSGTSTHTLIWDNGVFSGSPGGNFTGGKYWPAEEVSWNFYASNAALTFSASGTTVAIANADTDVVVAKKESASYMTINSLTFEHILCQVGTVEMKAPEGYTVSNLRVSLEPIYSGTYNIKAGSWARGSASAAVFVFGTATAGLDIATAGGAVKSTDNDLWLVPGNYTLTATYTISKGDFSKEYSKNAVVTLVQGQNNNFILPDTDGDGQNDDSNIPDPSNDVKDIVFSIEVTPWGENDVPVNFS